MENHSNKIGAAALAKRRTMRRTESISENKQINKLINNIAKHSNYAYSSAIARSKLAPIDELQRRVERKLRPHYSADRFADLQRSISSLPPLERYDFLKSQEQQINAKARRS